jgi:hypothetical protein
LISPTELRQETIFFVTEFPSTLADLHKPTQSISYSYSNLSTTIVPEMKIAAMELIEIIGYYIQANKNLKPASPKQLTKGRIILKAIL